MQQIGNLPCTESWSFRHPKYKQRGQHHPQRHVVPHRLCSRRLSTRCSQTLPEHLVEHDVHATGSGRTVGYRVSEHARRRTGRARSCRWATTIGMWECRCGQPGSTPVRLCGSRKPEEGRSVRRGGAKRRKERTWISLSNAATYKFVPSAPQHTEVTGHPISRVATACLVPSSPPSQTFTVPSSEPVATSSVPAPPAIVRSTLFIISW